VLDPLLAEALPTGALLAGVLLAGDGVDGGAVEGVVEGPDREAAGGAGRAAE
jgi:hypothetical protein